VTPNYTRDDRDDRYTGKTDDIAPDVLDHVRLQLLGTVVDCPAWLVSGLSVRTPPTDEQDSIWDIDFVEGGNGARYRYVPAAELWAEDIFAHKGWGEIACILVHECHEFYGMRDDGLDYSHAHDDANKVEGALRIALASGEVDEPATPAEAVALANDWLRNTGLGEQ
jgi:hypothetical protein